LWIPTTLQFNRKQLLHAHPPALVLLDEQELLGVLDAGRNHHSPAVPQLAEKRRRHQFGSRCHDDRVEWRFFRPSAISVTVTHMHVGVAQVGEPLGRRFSQRRDQLDGEHICPQIRQNGRLVARSCSDFENTVVAFDIGFLRH